MPATPVSFDKLTFVNNASGVAGIEVDGALLVNGTAVWNTSQVWSSDNENWDAAAPAENFFDGSLNTEAYAASGQSATVTFDAVTATSSIELYCKGQGGVQCWYATVDGVEKRLTVADEYGWVSVPGISYPADLTAIRHSQQTGGIKAVKVDGALLVNGAYTWNSSQVWSDGVTTPTDSSLPASNAFDGNPATYAESTAGTLEVTSSAFTDGSYEVEVKSSGGSSSITCNSSALTYSGSNNIWKGTVSNPFPLVITHHRSRLVFCEGERRAACRSWLRR